MFVPTTLLRARTRPAACADWMSRPTAAARTLTRPLACAVTTGASRRSCREPSLWRAGAFGVLARSGAIACGMGSPVAAARTRTRPWATATSMTEAEAVARTRTRPADGSANVTPAGGRTSWILVRRRAACGVVPLPSPTSTRRTIGAGMLVASAVARTRIRPAACAVTTGTSASKGTSREASRGRASLGSDLRSGNSGVSTAGVKGSPVAVERTRAKAETGSACTIGASTTATMRVLSRAGGPPWLEGELQRTRSLTSSSFLRRRRPS